MYKSCSKAYRIYQKISNFLEVSPFWNTLLKHWWKWYYVKSVKLFAIQFYKVVLGTLMEVTISYSALKVFSTVAANNSLVGPVSPRTHSVYVCSKTNFSFHWNISSVTLLLALNTYFPHHEFSLTDLRKEPFCLAPNLHTLHFCKYKYKYA